MPSPGNPRSPKQMLFEIRVQGHLRPEWATWFDGLTMEIRGEHTLLTGPVADQSALYGLLKRVRNLGLPLLAVNQIGTDVEEEK